MISKQRKWVGHYEQNGQMNPMEFEALKFKGPKVSGRGSDNVGQFFIDGKIDMNGRFEFRKMYVGAHNVLYEGERHYHIVKGRWVIPDYGGLSGDFEI